MNLSELNRVATAMVAPGRGILAADESTGTIKKRFDAIGVESTADNRRDYREMLFRSSEAMGKYISGVILYDETIRQNAKDGTPLVKLIEKAGSIPGFTAKPRSWITTVSFTTTVSRRMIGSGSIKTVAMLLTRKSFGRQKIQYCGSSRISTTSSSGGKGAQPR